MIATIANRVKHFLSDKNITLAIILLAILGRIIQLIYFFNIRVDGMYQHMATLNFVTGHGISTDHALPGDLSTTVYEPLINWPPGYSLLLSPFYIIFNHNYIAAGLTIDILAAIILIITCRRILHLLEIPLYLVNIFTLLTGFFIYYFYFIASSDAVAITFFIIALYFTVLLFKRNQFAVKITSAIFLCLFLSGLVKYLFIPIVFIVPVFIFLKGHIEKSTALKKTGVITFSLLTLTLATVLLYQKHISGSVAYISEPIRGFFPENLRDAWPVYPASFIKPDTIGLIFPSAVFTIIRIFQALNLLIFGGALLYMIRHITMKGFKKISTHDSFLYLTFFLSAGITLLLLLLSLRVAKEENFPSHLWTYIEDPRYYGLINVALHLCVFVGYQYYHILKTKALKIFVFSLLVLMLPETFRGIFFTARRVVNFKKEEYLWQAEYSIQKYADDIIQKEHAKLPASNALVTGSSFYLNNRVSIYSHIHTLTEVEKINDLFSLNTKKPVLLLVILQEKDLPRFLPFLSDKQKEFAGYFRGFYFYTTHVNPH